MKKSIKKITAIFLALMILMGITAVAPVSASEVVIEDNFFKTINNLKRTFIDGEYWNKDNAEDYSHTGPIMCSGNLAGIPCVNKGHCEDEGQCTCNCGVYIYNGEEKAHCALGFACMLGYKIFGTDPFSSDWTKSKDIYSVKPGDIVYANMGNLEDGRTKHAIFVTKVSGRVVTYVDCNGSGPCQVKWEKRTTVYELEKSLKYTSPNNKNNMWGYVAHANNNIMEAGTETHTHKYDTFVYAQEEHPHYKCYKCRCGDIIVKSEPTIMDNCRECIGFQPDNLGNFYSTISLSNTDKVIGRDNDNKISVQNRDNTTKQYWYFQHQDDNSYKIINGKDGKCLSVPKIEDNTLNVFVNTDSNDNYQRWFIKASDGKFQIVPKLYTNNILGLADGKTDVGTYAELSFKNEDSSQLFTLERSKNIQFEPVDLKGEYNAKTKKVDFSWSKKGYVNEYKLNINKVSTQGNPFSKVYKMAPNVTSQSVSLDSGKYEAYIDSINGFGTKTSKKITVTVPNETEINVPHTYIYLNKYTATIYTGKTTAVKCNNRDVSWKSSNTKVATVNKNGVIKGIAPGKVKITATANDGSKKSASCTVTVKAQKATKLAVSKKSVTLSKKGKTAQVKATLSPSNTYNKNISVMVSNKKTAKISSTSIKSGKNVKITAVKRGSAKVKFTAKDGSKKTAYCKVTVKK